MKYVVAIALLIAALVAVAFSAEDVNNLEKIHGIWFGRWTQRFNKKYADEAEQKKRFSIFKANLKKIQDKGADHEHFMTKFMDLTAEEFKAKYLSHMKPSSLKNLPRVSQVELSALKDTPTSFDWRQKNKVSKVKDQGDCGRFASIFFKYRSFRFTYFPIAAGLSPPLETLKVNGLSRMAL